MFRHCDEIHLLAYSPSVSPLIAIRKLFPLAFRSGIPNSEAVENSDEKLGLCGLCGGLVQWRECAAGCVAAVSGACANADMAWDSARFAALHEAGDRSDGDEGTGRRKTVDLYQQCLAADDDGLLANGEEHGRGGDRVPGRRIRNPRHRSRRHRGLRLACIPRHYLRAPEIRVPAPRSAPYFGAYPQSPIALEDAQRTISLVRFHAAEWHIDPHKIGVLGFSAGGHLVAATSVHFDRRLYPGVDAADQQSCRPDFAIAIYPGHLSMKAGSLELNPDIAAHITAQTPPTFLLQNEDDNVDSIWDSLTYYAALKKAGVPVEFHSYAKAVMPSAFAEPNIR